MKLYYSLLEDEGEYGVQVTMGEEAMSLRRITSVREDALSLLCALRRGTVTPVTLKDVVEDWLLR